MENESFGQKIKRKTTKIVKRILLSGIILLVGLFSFWQWGVYENGVMAGKVLRITEKGMIFKTYEGKLNLETFNALKGASPIAESFDFSVATSEEELIKQDDLNELYARISELEEFLKNSELPSRLQTLIERHINLIRQALAEYPIAGAKALIEARRSAVGELLELKGQFKDVPKNSAEINKLSELWDNFNTDADTALKVYGLIEIGQKVIELLPP